MSVSDPCANEFPPGVVEAFYVTLCLMSQEEFKVAYEKELLPDDPAENYGFLVCESLRSVEDALIGIKLFNFNYLGDAKSFGGSDGRHVVGFAYSEGFLKREGTHALGLRFPLSQEKLEKKVRDFSGRALPLVKVEGLT